MTKNLKIRRLYICALAAIFAGATLPTSLVAGEKEKIDGCLTALYNYPVKIRPAYRGKPLISLQARIPKESRQAGRVPGIPVSTQKK